MPDKQVPGLVAHLWSDLCQIQNRGLQEQVAQAPRRAVPPAGPYEGDCLVEDVFRCRESGRSTPQLSPEPGGRRMRVILLGVERKPGGGIDEKSQRWALRLDPAFPVRVVFLLRQPYR